MNWKKELKPEFPMMRATAVVCGGGSRFIATTQNQTFNRETEDMKTIEITNFAPHAEDGGAMDTESGARQLSAAAGRPTTAKPKREARVRYALLIVIALLAGGLGVFVHNALNVIDSNIEMTQTNILRSR
jgi:hypothetical protein